MKKLLAICAVLAVALGTATLGNTQTSGTQTDGTQTPAAQTPAAQAPAADVTGTWTGQLSTPNGDVQLTFRFKQDGGKLTGSVETSMGTGSIDIQNGKIDGDKIYWETSFNDMTIQHDGTVNGDEMKVTVKGSGDNGFPPADITLKRTKQ